MKPTELFSTANEYLKDLSPEGLQRFLETMARRNPLVFDHASGEMCVDACRLVGEAGLLENPVLDHGYVNLVDVMPRLLPVDCEDGDSALADAARVSYQKGTRKVRGNSALVDYLVRKLHTSPLEMAELKFSVRAPLFVARQWVR